MTKGLFPSKFKRTHGRQIFSISVVEPEFDMSAVSAVMDDTAHAIALEHYYRMKGNLEAISDTGEASRSLFLNRAGQRGFNSAWVITEKQGSHVSDIRTGIRSGDTSNIVEELIAWVKRQGNFGPVERDDGYVRSQPNDEQIAWALKRSIVNKGNYGAGFKDLTPYGKPYYDYVEDGREESGRIVKDILDFYLLNGGSDFNILRTFFTGDKGSSDQRIRAFLNEGTARYRVEDISISGA